MTSAAGSKASTRSHWMVGVSKLGRPAGITPTTSPPAERVTSPSRTPWKRQSLPSCVSVAATLSAAKKSDPVPSCSTSRNLRWCSSSRSRIISRLFSSCSNSSAGMPERSPAAPATALKSPSRSISSARRLRLASSVVISSARFWALSSLIIFESRTGSAIWILLTLILFSKLRNPLASVATITAKRTPGREGL